MGMLETIGIIFEIWRRKGFLPTSFFQVSPGQRNFYICTFQFYKTCWWRQRHTELSCKCGKFYSRMGEFRTAVTSWHTINFYKFTPPNTLGYQYQAADALLKRGGYPATSHQYYVLGHNFYMIRNSFYIRLYRNNI